MFRAVSCIKARDISKWSKTRPITQRSLPFPPRFLKSRYPSCFEFFHTPFSRPFRPVALPERSSRRKSRTAQQLPHFLFIQPERASYFRFRESNDIFLVVDYFQSRRERHFSTDTNRWISALPSRIAYAFHHFAELPRFGASMGNHETTLRPVTAAKPVH